MEELARLGDNVAWSLISLMPKKWRSARFTADYILDDRDSFSLRGVIENLNGRRELLTMSDHLADCLLDHRAYFFESYGKAWTRYILVVTRESDDNWSANVEFEFAEEI